MAYSFEKDIQPAVFSITSVTALYCIYETGKTLLPSGYLLKDEQKNMLIN